MSSKHAAPLLLGGPGWPPHFPGLRTSLPVRGAVFWPGKKRALLHMLCLWLHDNDPLLFIYLLMISVCAWNRCKLGIRQPISLEGSLEREVLDKYMLADVFLLLVLVTGILVQMLWRSLYLLKVQCIARTETVMVLILLYLSGCTKIWT
jgi:hypothetical protein